MGEPIEESGDSPAYLLYEEGRKHLHSNQIAEALEKFRKSWELSPHFKTLELFRVLLKGRAVARRRGCPGGSHCAQPTT
jgi:hypothetical protein